MTTKEEAIKIASFVGCSGAHMDKDGDWMPCSSPAILQRISADAEPKKKAAVEEFSVNSRLSQKKRGKRKFRGAGYEKLRERGIRGIDTMPDGSLTSAQPGSPGALF